MYDKHQKNLKANMLNIVMDQATFNYILMNQSTWQKQYDQQQILKRKEYNHNAAIKQRKKMCWIRLMRQIRKYKKPY